MPTIGYKWYMNTKYLTWLKTKYLLKYTKAHIGEANHFSRHKNVTNEWQTCQITFEDEKTHYWKEPMNQHLKYPVKLSNFAIHEELGIF